MKVFRAIFGIGLLAFAAALPWLVQGHLDGDSRGSQMAESVRGWFSSNRDVTSAALTPPPNSRDRPSGMHVPVSSNKLATSSRAKTAAARVTPILEPELSQLKLKLGDPIFIRIFKEEKEFEIWMMGEGESEFQLFKTYEIAKHSGKLGPKLKQGDRQAPEGFYFVNAGRMNPNSDFHLSFDLGYPNAFDQYHGRTGDFLMVHGGAVSIGCFAMTDPKIEEIYTIAAAAISGGQKFFRVHSFPFRMTDKRMNEETKKKAKWLEFWGNLKEGYDYFEMMKLPPNVTVKDGRYVFGSG